MKRLEIGVFLPVAKNGFIRSTRAPSYEPCYRDNLAITKLAEEVGLDYAFSMLKWRGFGGRTRFWDSSLDSFSLMTALAAATQRISLIATVSPVAVHPAVMAKMSSTVDDVSGGRLGLNIVTGAVLAEYGQMGIVPAGYDDDRYGYASEWVQVLKRLWTEETVTHDGRYFQLQGCVSDPKPVQNPHPFLVCAGISDEGIRFTAREADYSFITASDSAATKALCARVKTISAEQGRSLKTATMKLIVLEDTVEKARSYWDYLSEAADIEAIQNTAAILGSQSRESAKARGAEHQARPADISAAARPIIGDPEAVAESLSELAVHGDLDSIMLTFADYLQGLRGFADKVLPLLAKDFDVGSTMADRSA
jgi:pyrimidine oxygenase